jgi:hypothetical protein
VLRRRPLSWSPLSQSIATPNISFGNFLGDRTDRTLGVHIGSARGQNDVAPLGIGLAIGMPTSMNMQDGQVSAVRASA